MPTAKAANSAKKDRVWVNIALTPMQKETLRREARKRMLKPSVYARALILERCGYDPTDDPDFGPDSDDD